MVPGGEESDYMFKQLEDSSESQKKKDIGTVDLTDTENLDLKKASIAITHDDTQYPLHSPIDERVEQEDELSTQEILNIFQKLAGAGVEHLTITGGEPTLRPDFRTIVQYAVKKFDNVLVQTNGTTDRNLSQHDITVSIPIEYLEPVDNNEVRRMTNPSKYIYSRRDQKVIRKTKTKSKLTDEVFDNKQKAMTSVTNGTRNRAIDFFNKKTGANCTEWEEVKNHPEYSADIFLEREEPKDLLEEEQALQLALRKADQLPDNTPLIIRSNIYSNNNLLKIIAYGHIVDAKVVFKPLYPVGRNKKLLEQLPRPERFYKAMQVARELNTNIKQDIEVDSPLYKAWNYEKSLEELQQPSTSKDTYMNWWKRGRVSDVGVNKVHIAPNGECMPSKYIRHSKYRLGNINNKGVENIKQGMADFNEKIFDKSDYEPVTGFDLRQRSIAGDPNIFLNKPYPTAQTEVN